MNLLPNNRSGSIIRTLGQRMFIRNEFATKQQVWVDYQDFRPENVYS